MLKELLDGLAQRIIQGMAAENIFEDSEFVHVLTRDGDGDNKVTAFRKPAPGRRHEFADIRSFTCFLNDNISGDAPKAIFVGDSVVQANLNYHKRAWDRCAMPLVQTEAFQAMQSLQQPHTQKLLWEMLETTLYGYIDDSLRLAIANVQISDEAAEKCIVSVLGVAETSSSRALKLTFPSANGGSQDVELPEEWVWEGPVWDCLESAYKVTLRLIVDTSHGIQFRFVPRALDTVVQGAREDLMAVLIHDCPNIAVYAGDHGAWTREKANEPLPYFGATDVAHSSVPISPEE